TLFVAASAVFTLSGTVRTGHELGELSQAQRLHQDADMMHDALRADLANAQAAGRGAPTQTKSEILRASQSHAAAFRSDPEGMQKLTLPGDARAMLAASRAPREAYISLALRLVESTLRTGSIDPAG